MTNGYDWQWYKKKCPHRENLGQHHHPRDCPICLEEARQSFRRAYEEEKMRAFDAPSCWDVNGEVQ